MMESEQETKICSNCKREIPAVNYTIHTVHCARNIRVCPVCKEPVPQHELDEHHEKLHKLLPCKQCGESVCGTDLEDHIRDSCGHTIKSCRYCELELPRRELPTHENYCGVRTERCTACGEYVMIKYRQLHLDSNHGFLRLDDDPVPQPKKEPPKININRNMPSSSNGIRNIQSARANDPITVNKLTQNGPSRVNGPSSRDGKNSRINGPLNTQSALNTRDNGPHNSRANGPTSIDGTRRLTNSPVNGPNPFTQGPSTTIRYFNTNQTEVRHHGNPVNSRSNLGQERLDAVPSGSGVKKVLKRTNDQPQINTAVHAVDKVHKEFASRSGAVKKRPAPAPPSNRKREQAACSALLRQQREQQQRDAQSAYNASIGLPPVLNPAEKLERLRKMDALHNRETEEDYRNRLRDNCVAGNRLGRPEEEDAEAARRRDEFKDLKPMSPAEFMERFRRLGVREGPEPRKDRFSEIKTSLRELRKGLNEVTAPYNANASAPSSNPSPSVQLPCEFCGAPVPEEDLVQHQTGCRPDLARFQPSPSPSPSPVPFPVPFPDPYSQPVIPCEFCTESLPVYLISEHQERCRRESTRLFPD